MKKLLLATAMTACMLSTANAQDGNPLGFFLTNNVIQTKPTKPSKSKPSTPYAASGSIHQIIIDYAAKHRVNPKLALAVAKKESNFNPRVTGSVGEIGLFQIKCQTARGLGFSGACGGLYNASVNAHYGTKHLSIGRDTCGTDEGAAKLHNAGLAASCSRSAYSRSVMRLAANI